MSYLANFVKRLQFAIQDAHRQYQREMQIWWNNGRGDFYFLRLVILDGGIYYLGVNRGNKGNGFVREFLFLGSLFLSRITNGLPVICQDE